MKLLYNHVASFHYTATEQTDIGPDLDDAKKTGETGEALLVKVCTEPGDDLDTVDRAVEEITDVSTQFGGIDRVILFPWAHLSDDLADPTTAQDLLDALADRTAAAGYDPLPVPFGWYKEWDLRSKGHPMSVLTRAI